LGVQLTADGIPVVTHPVRLVFANRVGSWYGDAIATSLGVPGHATASNFTHMVLAFWGCNGPQDTAMIWRDAAMYFGDQNTFGKTTQEIQVAIRKLYNGAGKYIMVSAFGDSQMPTSLDPTTCGKALGQFVLDNNLDGADVDYEDNNAMNNGVAETWLIQFTIAVRQVIPSHILTHAPQAPYFKE
jgi:hypothetical protein